MSMAAVIEKRWWCGGPRDIWVRNASAIAEFIAANHLQPLDRALLDGMAPTAAREREVTALLPIPFPGGMKTAHLHFKGDVFLVNPDQWKGFAAKMMKEYQSRLARAGAVSFTELMAVADAIEGVV